MRPVAPDVAWATFSDDPSNTQNTKSAIRQIAYNMRAYTLRNDDDERTMNIRIMNKIVSNATRLVIVTLRMPEYST